MNISIAARVGIGFVTQLILLVVCGAAGIIAVDKVSESLLFISGTAMKASEQGMKTSISLQSEMLLIERILSNGISREQSTSLLESYQQSSQDSLDQVKASSLISTELLDNTHKGVLSYRSISAGVVDQYSMLKQQKGDAKHQVEEMIAVTEQIKKSLDEIADSDDIFISDARIASIFENLEQFRLDLILSNSTLVEIFTAEDLDQQLVVIKQSREVLKQSVEKTLKSLSVPALSEYKQLVEQRYQGFEQSADQLVQDYLAFTDQRQQLSASIDHLLALLSDMEVASAQQINSEVSRVDELINRSSSLMLTTAVTGVLVAIAAIAVLFLTVVKPIRIVARNLKQIGEGEGDLSVALKESGARELVTLAKGFNAFVHKIQRTVSGVTYSVEELHQSATKLAEISNTTAQAIQQQSAETEQAAAALNEMSATASTVSEHAQQAAKAATAADQSAGQGSQNVGATIDAIQLQMSELNQAAHVVEQLANDSDGIGNVLVVIDEIAEQTNLLALNAAIEAARAGEAGRGFAVVADEVRQLASRTQTATTEIQDVVKNLRNSALEAVSAMQNSITAAGKSSEMAQHSGHSLSAITQESKTISDMNLQIASAAEQQAAVSEDINQNVIAISERARETQTASDEIQQATEQLSELAQRLGGLVKGFKY